LAGKGVDFYNHLNIEPSATTSELNKAYRKKSLELQYVSSATAILRESQLIA